MKKIARTIDDYLVTLSAEKRAALQRLRSQIKAAAPSSEECISYGIPGFRVGKRLLVSFGAAKNHCAFYPGARPIRVHQADLERYDTSTGTIRYAAEKPLPAALVKKLVRSRLDQSQL